MDCAAYDSIPQYLPTVHAEINVCCRHTPRLLGHRVQRNGAYAGGEQPRAEGLVPRAGGLQGR